MILAIETSCDETSAAIVSGGKILSNTLFSQVKKHRKYGGVVPELASRIHADVIDKIIQQAIQDAGIRFSDLSHIAVTSGPGLEGALMVGIAAAQTLANLLHIPLIPVNHLHGHIYAAEVSGELKFPLVVCLASGGHTQLIYMKEDLSFEISPWDQDRGLKNILGSWGFHDGHDLIDLILDQPSSSEFIARKFWRH